MTKEQQRTLEIALCGYLPYGLMILRPDGRTVLLLKGIDGGSMMFQETGTPNESYGDFSGLSKPVLRPLSDLTIAITHNGESFVPIEQLRRLGIIDHLDWISNEREHWIKTRGHDKWLGEIPFKTIEHLTEWLFDYRGLIESGLAISVHDLPENPYEKYKAE